MVSLVTTVTNQLNDVESAIALGRVYRAAMGDGHVTVKPSLRIRITFKLIMKKLIIVKHSSLNCLVIDISTKCD